MAITRAAANLLCIECDEPCHKGPCAPSPWAKSEAQQLAEREAALKATQKRQVEIEAIGQLMTGLGLDLAPQRPQVATRYVKPNLSALWAAGKARNTRTTGR